MNERTTAERPIRGASALRARFRPWYLAAIVVVIALVLVAARLTETPKTVGHLVVQNPTKFDLSVAVSGGDASGWMAVGAVRRGSTTTFRDVVDQGDTWTFRFSAQGKDSDLEVSREDLARAGWKLEVPTSVSDALRAKGAEFPP
jgi:hypothetical protein